MTHDYEITGMTCNACIAKVKSELLKSVNITTADVQLQSPQARISMQHHIPLHTLQTAVRKAGNYIISEAGAVPHLTGQEEKKTWLGTYKPVLLIFVYCTVSAGIAAGTNGGFDTLKGMRIFMAGFFLSFSFFKLLDLRGFADSYAAYDIIAKRFKSWGFIYAFIELGLGIAYAAAFNPLITNFVTLIVMLVSLVGVLQAVLQKRKIRCACLGAVFNLPMTTVTIIEDGLMIAMSAGMLLILK